MLKEFKEKNAYELLSSRLEDLIHEYNNEYYIDIEPCYLSIFPDGQITFTLLLDNENDDEILIMSCKFYSMSDDCLENALARHFKKKINISKKEKKDWRKKNER